MRVRSLGIVFLVSSFAASAFAADRAIQNGIDVWSTKGDGSTFVDFAQTPIPAGFFCAGSAPFTARVAFQGVPIVTDTPKALGATDTIVQRLDDATFNKRGVAVTRTQVRALSLKSVTPFETGCGKFEATVRLDGVQPITQMVIRRENENGGNLLRSSLAQREGELHASWPGQPRGARDPDGSAVPGESRVSVADQGHRAGARRLRAGGHGWRPGRRHLSARHLKLLRRAVEQAGSGRQAGSVGEGQNLPLRPRNRRSALLLPHLRDLSAPVELSVSFLLPRGCRAGPGKAPLLSSPRAPFPARPGGRDPSAEGFLESTVGSLWACGF